MKNVLYCLTIIITLMSFNKTQASSLPDLHEIQSLHRVFTTLDPENVIYEYWNNDWGKSEFERLLELIAWDIARRFQDNKKIELKELIVSIDPFFAENPCLIKANNCYSWREIPQIDLSKKHNIDIYLPKKDQIIAGFIRTTSPHLFHYLNQAEDWKKEGLELKKRAKVIHAHIRKAVSRQVKTALVLQVNNVLKHPHSKALYTFLVHADEKINKTEQTILNLRQEAQRLENTLKNQVFSVKDKAIIAGDIFKNRHIKTINAQAEILEKTYQSLINIRNSGFCAAKIEAVLTSDLKSKTCAELYAHLSIPENWSKIAKDKIESATKDAREALQADIAREIADGHKNAHKKFETISPVRLMDRQKVNNTVIYQVYVLSHNPDISMSTIDNNPKIKADSATQMEKTGIEIRFSIKKEGDQILEVPKKGKRLLSINRRVFQAFLHKNGWPKAIHIEDIKLPKVDLQNLNFEISWKTRNPFSHVIKTATTHWEHKLSLPPKKANLKNLATQVQQQIQHEIHTIQNNFEKNLLVNGVPREIRINKNIQYKDIKPSLNRNWKDGIYSYDATLILASPIDSCDPLSIPTTFVINGWQGIKLKNNIDSSAFQACIKEHFSNRVTNAITALSPDLPDNIYDILVFSSDIKQIRDNFKYTVTGCVSGNYGDYAIIPKCTEKNKDNKGILRFSGNVDFANGRSSLRFSPKPEKIIKKTAVKKLEALVSSHIPKTINVFGVEFSAQRMDGKSHSYILNSEYQGYTVTISNVTILTDNEKELSISFDKAKITCNKSGNQQDCVNLAEANLVTTKFGKINFVKFHGTEAQLSLFIDNPFTVTEDYTEVGSFFVDPLNGKINLDSIPELAKQQLHKQLRNLIFDTGLFDKRQLSEKVSIEFIPKTDTNKIEDMLRNFDIVVRNIDIGPVSLPLTIEIRENNAPKFDFNEKALASIVSNLVLSKIDISYFPCNNLKANTQNIKNITITFDCKVPLMAGVNADIKNAMISKNGLKLNPIFSFAVAHEVPIGTTGLMITPVIVTVDLSNLTSFAISGDIVPVNTALGNLVKIPSRLTIDLKALQADVDGSLRLLNSMNLAELNGTLNIPNARLSWNGRSTGLMENIIKASIVGETNGKKGIHEYHNKIKFFDIADQNLKITITSKGVLRGNGNIRFIDQQFTGGIKTREQLSHLSGFMEGTLKVPGIGIPIADSRFAIEPHGAELLFTILGFDIDIYAYNLSSINGDMIYDRIKDLFRVDKILKSLLKAIIDKKLTISVTSPIGSGKGSPLNQSPPGKYKGKATKAEQAKRGDPKPKKGKPTPKPTPVAAKMRKYRGGIFKTGGGGNDPDAFGNHSHGPWKDCIVEEPPYILINNVRAEGRMCATLKNVKPRRTRVLNPVHLQYVEDETKFERLKPKVKLENYSFDYVGLGSWQEVYSVGKKKGYSDDQNGIKKSFLDQLEQSISQYNVSAIDFSTKIMSLHVDLFIEKGKTGRKIIAIAKGLKKDGVFIKPTSVIFDLYSGEIKTIEGQNLNLKVPQYFDVLFNLKKARKQNKAIQDVLNHKRLLSYRALSDFIGQAVRVSMRQNRYIPRNEILFREDKYGLWFVDVDNQKIHVRDPKRSVSDSPRKNQLSIDKSSLLFELINKGKRSPFSPLITDILNAKNDVEVLHCHRDADSYIIRRSKNAWEWYSNGSRQKQINVYKHNGAISVRQDCPASTLTELEKFMQHSVENNFTSLYLEKESIGLLGTWDTGTGKMQIGEGPGLLGVPLFDHKRLLSNNLKSAKWTGYVNNARSICKKYGKSHHIDDPTSEQKLKSIMEFFTSKEESPYCPSRKVFFGQAARSLK